MSVCVNCKNKNVLIECACGCGGIRTAINKNSVPRRFINGHLGTLENSNNWKGGRVMDVKGYWVIWKNGTYVKEHRLIYEEYHKCCLLSWGDIHHINNDRQDNRIENLKGMTHAQHISLEHTGMVHTEEAKKKIRLACIGRPSSFKGRKHSEESRIKISIARKRRSLF
jgi:hypothetical protein